MITVKQAQSKLVERNLVTKKVINLPIAAALGSVAAFDITSSIAVPPQDNSAMDGVAVNTADFSGPGTRLSISQRIPAGAQPQALISGTAARIFTGGVIPPGADAVVIQENCQFDENAQNVLIEKTVTRGANIRPQGQDITIGDLIIKQGRRLTAVDLGLIASIGQAEVAVFEKLKVAIFSTGNELIDPGASLKPGQIYNSNRTMLIALCEQLGYRTIDCGIVTDTLDATISALANAATDADVIITSGGVSVGEEDYVKAAIQTLGQLELWKVQMKPGKPVAFGNIKGVPILGLPGNPVSSFVVFQLFGIPLLRSCQGQTQIVTKAYTVACGFSKTEVSREEYIRVKLSYTKDGQCRAEMFNNPSSGVLSSLAWADGLVRLPIDYAVAEGQAVEFLPLKDGIL